MSSAIGKVGDGLGSVFGKVDSAATNTVDKAGDVVATGTPGGMVVPDPKEGLSTGNMLARGLTRGLGKGLQSMNQQPQQHSGGSQINPIPAPKIDPSFFAPQNPWDPRKQQGGYFGNNSMLYGG